MTAFKPPPSRSRLGAPPPPAELPARGNLDQPEHAPVPAGAGRGRPAKFVGVETKDMNFKVSVDVHTRFARAAIDAGLSRVDLLKLLLERWEQERGK